MSLGVTLLDLPVRHVLLRRGPLALIDVDRPGRPALFVPGYTGSKEDFALLVEPVTAAGHRFLALDQRGQYESPGPDDPAAYTVDALAGELVELLDRLDAGPVHLIGHSFGGLVARAATIRAPHAVASLALLGSGPAALTGGRVAAMEALRPVLDAYGVEAVFEAVAAAAAHDPRRRIPSPELASFLRRRFLASPAAALRGMGDAVTSEPDRVADLRATGVPVFVASGEGDDAWTPAQQREMAERLGAPYREIRGALHSPAAEAPAATAGLLVDFWARVDRGSAGG